MRILCFGDSNTYGFDPRSFLGGRYSAQYRWVDILGTDTGWEIFNGGENGREIPERAGEWARFEYLLSATKPEYLLVMLGGNDLLQGADATAVAEKMCCFLQRVPLSKEKIILIAPPPMKWGAWVTEERLLTESTKLGPEYAELANRLGVRFLDTGDWGITLAFDGVHFDEAGHQRFAKSLKQALREDTHTFEPI